MKRLILMLCVVFSFNSIACEDLDLYKTSFKVGIQYRYALFTKLEVAKDLVVYSKNDAPHTINVNFKNDLKETKYQAKFKFDVKKSSVEEGAKIVQIHFSTKHFDRNNNYSRMKNVFMKSGEVKNTVLYDRVNGEYFKLTLKEFTKGEWSEMSCPGEEA